MQHHKNGVQNKDNLTVTHSFHGSVDEISKLAELMIREGVGFKCNTSKNGDRTIMWVSDEDFSKVEKAIG